MGLPTESLLIKELFGERRNPPSIREASVAEVCRGRSREESKVVWKLGVQIRMLKNIGTSENLYTVAAQ